MTMGRTAVRCPAVLALYFVCMGLLYPILAENEPNIIKVTADGEVGGIATINCTTSTEKANITWWFGDIPLKIDDRIEVTYNETSIPNDEDGYKRKQKTTILTIANVTSKDAGNYTCFADFGSLNDSESANLTLTFEASVVNVTNSVYTNVTDNETVVLECVFEVYDMTAVKWVMEGRDGFVMDDFPTRISAKEIKSNHSVRIHSSDDNGTYVCEIEDPVTSKKVRGTIDIFVIAPPNITINQYIGINTTEVYLNWTINRHNSKIKVIYLMRANMTPDAEFTFDKRIDPNNTSVVMKGLKQSTKYRVKLFVETDHYSSYSAYREVETLAEEPIFVPNISINGFSATSVTIGWAPPPPSIEKYIHYYLLEAKKKNENGSSKAYHQRDGRNLPYMFGNLQPHSTYIFRVRACSDYGGERCGNWSDEMEAATLDGTPGKPSDVRVECTASYMNLSWGPPDKPNAEIKGYTMELTGNATFKDRYGKLKQTTWGPYSKFTTNESRNVRFDDLQPNTNYTVRLSAMTRTRRRGEEQAAHCATRRVRPDQPPRPRWRKILENGTYMFKMYLPRISERNGPICCYRVYMVRLLPHWDWKNLPAPERLPVLRYADAHAQPPALGAYITDVFSNENFPPESELVMGDASCHYSRDDRMLQRDACRRCGAVPRRLQPPTTTTTTTTSTTSTTTENDYDMDTEDPVFEEPRIRRSRESDYSKDPTMLNKPEDEKEKLILIDGPLDPTANYTLFVELITGIEEEAPVFSNYVNALMPAATPVASQPSSALEIALQVTCAVAALILLLMILFCIRQTRRSRKVPPHANLELNPLQIAYRYITGLGGRPQMVPSAPPDMPPIAKEDLAAAYAEKQVDSDYGFQKEFEMLPECFPDRTTHASEARENQPKNRYPDIKAYDQTRVKLSQIDSITGSDYINANYVMGYQERKRFICAQGPTETTVNDFWRMIWEHGLELIVMLTNLEEYSKVKCSKYWPDELRGARAFGNITVHHVSEKRYSDYIVRELRITKQPTTADGQPIVENNGIAKRNGDCKEAAEGSAPTSPREGRGEGRGEGRVEGSRLVRQYHFLMWKDFAAPEHAYSILKFIKRVNEAWSNMVSRPAVVHCSAGVGRTGTLVALDCLLEQLRAEGHAAVFNTVAELRRQRNFLVQSLKQYVFVYRALVEYAQFGDTELAAGRLKAAIDRLRNTPPGAATCLMEIEFEKILNSPITEPVKSCAAGAAEELRSKNRSQDILPYDRNRVILAPIPTRDFSTYINASFIEAYDNSETFIITQDPLPNTIVDFWRMVSEHNVTTIVMLSELGDGKCPRYWDDGTAQYEHISVQYEESESCPYYTRRQFRVVNNKSGAALCARQLQYQGWPTAAGHVPEVTRGLAELADAATGPRPHAPMLVHCQLGTERSALFVALCILICQLRTERRIDVCTLARKVRSQRAHTIDTFLHYEFLHRAILNYAELHNLLEDS